MTRMDMRLSIAALVFACVLSAAPATAQAPMIGARSTPATDTTSTLKVGDIAPDFELPDQSGKPVKLSDFRGKRNVVLAFYVLAFTGG